MYDPANRLTSVNGQAYMRDDNGNLEGFGEKAQKSAEQGMAQLREATRSLLETGRWTTSYVGSCFRAGGENFRQVKRVLKHQEPFHFLHKRTYQSTHFSVIRPVRLLKYRVTHTAATYPTCCTVNRGASFCIPRQTSAKVPAKVYAGIWHEFMRECCQT